MEIISALIGLSNNNFLKFLTLMGGALVVLSLFYPLERKFEIQDQKLISDKVKRDLEIKAEFINKNIESLNKESQILTKKITERKISLSKREELLKRFNEKFESINDQSNLLKINESESKYEAEKLTVLMKRLETYQIYSNVLFWSGVVFMLTGFFGWMLTRKKKGS